MSFSWKVRPTDWATGQLITATDFKDYITGNLNYLKYRTYKQVSWDYPNFTTTTTTNSSWTNVGGSSTLTITQPEPNKTLVYMIGFSGVIRVDVAGPGFKVGVSIDGNDPFDTRMVVGTSPGANAQVPFSLVTQYRFTNAATPQSQVIRLRWNVSGGNTLGAGLTWLLWYAELSTEDI